MKVLVVDNEQDTRQSVVSMIQAFCPGITHIEETDSVASTLNKLKTYIPDVVFLDVELNDGTGIEILSQLKSIEFQVIFITAHDKYAIDAFRYSAIDFLLKPINIDALRGSMRKAEQKIDSKILAAQLNVLQEYLGSLYPADKKIVLRDSEYIYFVKINDIIRCESEGPYTRFYMVNGEKVTISKTIKEYDQLLEKYGFIRVHQSHLVNISKVRRFDRGDGGTLVLDNNHSVPVSQRKKDHILNILKNI